MAYGMAIDSGSAGSSLTYSDTEALHAGVLVRTQFIEFTDTMNSGVNNYVDIDFTADVAGGGYINYAFTVIPTGCCLTYGNPLGLYYVAPWPNMWRPNVVPPTVTLSGTVLRVASNSDQFQNGPAGYTFNPWPIIYQSFNVLILGIK